MRAATTITTPQGTFVADVAGAGGAPTVLLLHGFPQSRYTWRSILPALAGAGMRAVAPDQRGYTPGVRPTDVDAYATPRLVADVIDLLDALDVERVHLVGHDLGGQVAWLTAAQHPDRLQTLTVLSRPHPAAFARSFEVDSGQRERSRHHSRMTDSVAERLWVDDCAALRTMLTNGGVPAADAAAYVTTFADRAALDAAMNWYRASAQGGGLRASDTPSVTVSTLYLWGTADATVGRAAAELTREHVTGAYRFVEIEAAGHFLTDDGAGPTVEHELVAHVTG